MSLHQGVRLITEGWSECGGVKGGGEREKAVPKVAVLEAEGDGAVH